MNKRLLQIILKRHFDTLNENLILNGIRNMMTVRRLFIIIYISTFSAWFVK